jgi:Flp pilus assembly protein TadD
MALGEPERAVPMLTQSERDFPADYNPPARLAAAYLAMKHDDEALDACRRALARAYGPRKLRLWSLEADVLVAKGDTAGARGALQEALDFAAHTPLPASYPKQVDAIRARLGDLR